MRITAAPRSRCLKGFSRPSAGVTAPPQAIRHGIPGRNGERETRRSHLCFGERATFPSDALCAAWCIPCPAAGQPRGLTFCRETGLPMAWSGRGTWPQRLRRGRTRNRAKLTSGNVEVVGKRSLSLRFKREIFYFCSHDKMCLACPRIDALRLDESARTI